MIKSHVTMFIITFIVVPVFGCAAGDPKPRTFSRSDAEVVLHDYLRSTGAAKRPGFVLEEAHDPYNPTFYFFSALADNGSDASVVLGNYAVDQRTGDIWDGSVCEEMISPASRARQKQIRERLHVTPAEYEKLKRSGPTC